MRMRKHSHITDKQLAFELKNAKRLIAENLREAYNFCRIHQTLKVTPAMEAGITDHVWSLEQICALLPKPTVRASKVEKNLVAKALNERVTG